MASEREIIDAVCEATSSPTVAEHVRRVAKTRSSTDPNYWMSVALREHWKETHGSYDAWDRTCRAGGLDPASFQEAQGAS